MYNSKIFIVFLSTVLVVSSLIMFFDRSEVVYAKKDSGYSGEELYKGIVFGQDEIGRKLVSNDDEYKRMNSPETKKFLNGLVEYIKSKDSVYFSNLKIAVENNDPNETLKLLQSSGKYFDEYLNKLGSDAKTQEGPGFRCGFAAVCVAAVVAGVYNYVVAVQAGVALQVGYAVWALKTKAVNNATKLRSSDSLNRSTNPEQEVVRVLKVING